MNVPAHPQVALGLPQLAPRMGNPAWPWVLGAAVAGAAAVGGMAVYCRPRVLATGQTTTNGQASTVRLIQGCPPMQAGSYFRRRVAFYNEVVPVGGGVPYIDTSYATEAAARARFQAWIDHPPEGLVPDTRGDNPMQHPRRFNPLAPNPVWPWLVGAGVLAAGGATGYAYCRPRTYRTIRFPYGRAQEVGAGMIALGQAEFTLTYEGCFQSGHKFCVRGTYTPHELAPEDPRTLADECLSTYDEAEARFTELVDAATEETKSAGASQAWNPGSQYGIQVVVDDEHGQRMYLADEVAPTPQDAWRVYQQLVPQHGAAGSREGNPGGAIVAFLAAAGIGTGAYLYCRPRVVLTKKIDEVAPDGNAYAMEVTIAYEGCFRKYRPYQVTVVQTDAAGTTTITESFETYEAATKEVEKAEAIAAKIIAGEAVDRGTMLPDLPAPDVKPPGPDAEPGPTLMPGQPLVVDGAARFEGGGGEIGYRAPGETAYRFTEIKFGPGDVQAMMEDPELGFDIKLKPVIQGGISSTPSSGAPANVTINLGRVQVIDGMLVFRAMVPGTYQAYFGSGSDYTTGSTYTVAAPGKAANPLGALAVAGVSAAMGAAVGAYLACKPRLLDREALEFKLNKSDHEPLSMVAEVRYLGCLEGEDAYEKTIVINDRVFQGHAATFEAAKAMKVPDLEEVGREEPPTPDVEPPGPDGIPTLPAVTEGSTQAPGTPVSAGNAMTFAGGTAKIGYRSPITDSDRPLQVATVQIAGSDLQAMTEDPELGIDVELPLGNVGGSIKLGRLQVIGGQLVFRGLPPGSYRVEVSGPNGAQFTRNYTVAIPTQASNPKCPPGTVWLNGACVEENYYQNLTSCNWWCNHNPESAYCQEGGVCHPYITQSGRPTLPGVAAQQPETAGLTMAKVEAALLRGSRVDHFTGQARQWAHAAARRIRAAYRTGQIDRRRGAYHPRVQRTAYDLGWQSV